MRKTLLAVLLALCFPLIPFAQTDRYKIVYEFKDSTIYYSRKVKRVPGKVLLSETKGWADTTLAFFTGQVVDDKNSTFQAVVTIESLRLNKQITLDTDENGRFGLYIKPDLYCINFSDEFFVDSVLLQPGQIKELKISTGSKIVIQHWARIQPKTIRFVPVETKRKARKGKK